MSDRQAKWRFPQFGDPCALGRSFAVSPIAAIIVPVEKVVNASAESVLHQLRMVFFKTAGAE